MRMRMDLLQGETQARDPDWSLLDCIWKKEILLLRYLRKQRYWALAGSLRGRLLSTGYLSSEAALRLLSGVFFRRKILAETASRDLWPGRYLALLLQNLHLLTFLMAPMLGEVEVVVCAGVCFWKSCCCVCMPGVNTLPSRDTGNK